jgi:3-phosphoshikimate 1-carboxyvinyltransferase
MILGAMAEGTTSVTGLLEGADILSTAVAMKDFGAKIERKTDGTWTIIGCGAEGFKSPAGDVDCGNAGTGVRLIMGAAAGYPISATFTGDASLSSRPMGRVLDPLSEMGVTYTAQEGGRLPATLTSDGALSPLDYTPPHASAQVKSAILLAGLNTDGITTVNEPTLSRDHTENMLKAFGADVTVKPQGEGQKVSVKGPVTLKATNVNVPGDPSSAAFPIVAALTTPGSDIVIENVMMNPTRTGLFETLTEMGGYLRSDNFRTSGGEVIADIHVKHSKLHGVTVPENRAPSMIDEYPILAIAAAHASGTTVMRGISEMRVKESDRISATVALLDVNGVETTEYDDGFAVKGGGVAGGGTVTTHHDHRIAMSALVLGMNASLPVSIDDGDMIATSFPTFFELMNGLGAKIKSKSA